MFTKIDKKVLTILIIALIVILVSTFLIYKYISSSKTGVENTAGGVNTEEQKNQENLLTPQIEIEAEAVTGDSSSGGMLIVCLDKCGDSICQKIDEKCQSQSLNCICPETKEECPQDCK